MKWLWIYQHTSRKQGKRSFYWRSGAEDEDETDELIARSGKERNESERSVTNKMRYTHLDVVFMASFGDGCERLREVGSPKTPAVAKDCEREIL